MRCYRIGPGFDFGQWIVSEKTGRSLFTQIASNLTSLLRTWLSAASGKGHCGAAVKKYVFDESASMRARSCVANGIMLVTVDSKSKSNPSITASPNGRSAEASLFTTAVSADLKGDVADAAAELDGVHQIVELSKAVSAVVEGVHQILELVKAARAAADVELKEVKVVELVVELVKPSAAVEEDEEVEVDVVKDVSPASV